MQSPDFKFEPIGTFFGSANYKSEVPRQGVFFHGHPGRIELLPQHGFEEALRDLSGFERIWVIFLFDRNSGWRPTTRPPVPPKDHDRVGIFASRSPYRPNPIGLSCVRLLSVEKLTLHLDEADLLDGSPVLDIKPYIPKADSFPMAKAGWVDEQESLRWEIQTSELFQKQNEWLLNKSGFDLLSFAQCQLEIRPLDATRKRLQIDRQTNSAELAFRTFRIEFSFDEIQKKICLQKIRSGYTLAELGNSDDPYADKSLHLDFFSQFAQMPKT